MSKQSSQDDDHLGELYPLMFSMLTGEITIGEKQRFYQLLEDPRAQEAWEHFQLAYSDPEKITRVRYLMDHDDSSDIADMLVDQRQQKRKSRFAAAAIVIALLLGGAFFWQLKKAGDVIIADDVLSVTVGHKKSFALVPGINQLASYGIAFYDSVKRSIKIQAGNAATDELYTLNVPPGLQCTVSFPDNSYALVNAESRLSFPAVFNNTGRSVSLVGEAFFSVQSNASKPFYVKLQQSTVHVLGTSFTVNTKDSLADKITLKDGLVAIDVTGAPLKQLLPGQTAYAGKGAINVTSSEAGPAQWAEGAYELNEMPLLKMGPLLKQRFNIRIVFEPGFTENILYSGTIRADETFATFLDALRSQGKARFELHNNVLYVRK
ncbi:FecR family protein [Filimonas effusa]|uniref:DUF4974 domain-containing protein n=1 Tax=Filimonas effusa TaxID=2508721 RepID=A0A4Q1D1S3_9BACT|nr:FecR domain-containing protein [Filimonas effusa]RXK81771.1 DUF4974 domain-containing protein [Filimonas effusa]